jgi:hypothetical protein
VTDDRGVHEDVQRLGREDDQGGQGQTRDPAETGVYCRVSIDVCSARRACSTASSVCSLGLLGISTSFRYVVPLGKDGQPGCPEVTAGDATDR